MREAVAKASTKTNATLTDSDRIDASVSSKWSTKTVSSTMGTAVMALSRHSIGGFYPIEGMVVRDGAARMEVPSACVWHNHKIEV